MFYIFLVFLLILIVHLVGHGSFVIASYMGLNPEHARLLNAGYGAAIFVGLLVWAILDKGKKE